MPVRLSITSSKRKGGRKMSEENTAESNGSRSFQERVFARFDAVDNRLNVMDTRIEKLEMHEYDTKPIWEQALAAILETRAELNSGLTEVRSSLTETNSGLTEVRSGLAEVKIGLSNLRTDMETGFASVRDDMESGFTSVRNDVEHEGRKIARKLDALAESWLDLKADQRYLDRRLAALEERTNQN